MAGFATRRVWRAVWGAAMALSCGVAALAESPRGTLFIMGGAVSSRNQPLWSEFARLANGARRSVAVIPTASPVPGELEREFMAQLRSLGLTPFFVPCSPLLPGSDARQVAADAEWAERVRQADAVYLGGGDQARYRRFLYDERDEETPLLQAVRHVYLRGGVVAGTSAGAAVMSRLMFVEGESLRVLQQGARWRIEMDRGFGFLPSELLVDQHFLARGRVGRLLVAMAQHHFSLGVGVDEDTAVVIEGTKRLSVVGQHGVLIADGSTANWDRDEERFGCRDVTLHYLSHGDSFDFESREPLPSAEKAAGRLVDPRSVNFEPWYRAAQFHSDILAATRLRETLIRLVDSPHDEAFGLAFDPRAAQSGPAMGFEFRFQRGAHAASWRAADSTGDLYLVRDVRLDVRPVTFQFPLYR